MANTATITKTLTGTNIGPRASELREFLNKMPPDAQLSISVDTYEFDTREPTEWTISATWADVP